MNTLLQKRTIPEISKETLFIEQFIASQKLGSELTYKDIEKNTGVVMDHKGKTYMRAALKRLKYEYETIYDLGIRLFSPKNATNIIVNKLVRVDNAVKRSEKTYHNINDRFFDELPENEKRQVTFVGAIFGAIRMSARQGKEYFGNQKQKELANNKPIKI